MQNNLKASALGLLFAMLLVLIFWRVGAQAVNATESLEICKDKSCAARLLCEPPEPPPIIDETELLLLSKIIHIEAGSAWLSEEHRQMVGSVVLNRMASPEFPDTMWEVITQPGQYYKTTSAWFENLLPHEWCVETARYLLENGSVLPPNVIFQAESAQGSGVYASIYDAALDTTTYFCFSSRMGLYE